jgi:hypothetical protein
LQRGIRVVSDVQSQQRTGFNPAWGQTGAMSHSPRHPHGSREAMRLLTRRSNAVDSGAAQAVNRAGRLERCAGIPSPCLAITAGPTILSRWSRYSLAYPPSQQDQQRSLSWPKRGQAEPAFEGRLECTRGPIGERGAC